MNGKKLAGEKELHPVIELTRMNNEKIYLNANLIESVEVTPDRLITLVSDKKYYVLESAEEIVSKMEEFYRRIYTPGGKKKLTRP